MKLKKQVISAGLCTALVFQAAMPVFAAEKKAEYTKKESVYAKLQADGTAQDAYVINHFSVKKAGEIKDYGNYQDVKNLTSLSNLKTQKKQTDFTASKGEFYYQGTMQDVELPWKYKIKYELNNDTITADELGGKSGKLKIYISVKENKEGKDFFDHYVTQISLTLDNDKVKNIKAKGATIADAGADSQLSFTVLPGKEADFMIEADVTNFSMSGFSIAAVPYSMDIDLGDYGIDDMTGQFDELINATNELNTGMKKLSTGMQKLDANSGTLLKGMKDLNNGVGTLDHNSTTLVKGSAQIKKGLSTMSTSLSQADFSGMSQLKTLPASIKQMSLGLKKLRSGLLQLQEGFEKSYTALDQTMQQASTTTLTQEELALVKEQLANNAALSQKLDQTYSKLDTAVSDTVKAMPSDGDMQEILETTKKTDTKLYNELKNFYDQTKTLKTTHEQTKEAMKESVKNFATDSNAVQKLLTSYGSLQKLIGTWNAVKPAFEAVNTSLDQENQESVIYGLNSVINGLDQMSSSLSSSLEGVDIEKQMQSLQKGLSQLSSSYSTFHKGLKAYTKGVSSVYEGTSQYQNGLSKYFGGITSADQGLSTLSSGMQKYTDGVAQIPDQIQKTIDEMTEEYQSSDDKPQSFTDHRNKKIESVQFVISTQEIKQPEKKETKKEEKKKSFIDRLKALF